MSDKKNSHPVTTQDLQDMITKAVKTALAELSPPQAPVTSENKYLSRQDLCDQLGITLPTLDRIVKSGAIQTYRVGSRKILFKSEDVASYLFNHRQT